MPEGRQIFSTLSVAENLVATAANRLAREALDAGAGAALFPALASRLEQRAASLSGGEQQMLAIGRALMTNPRLRVFSCKLRKEAVDLYRIYLIDEMGVRIKGREIGSQQAYREQDQGPHEARHVQRWRRTVPPNASCRIQELGVHLPARCGSDELGLGGYGGSSTAPVSLALAREKAEVVRDQLARGLDPRIARKARATTFADCMEALLAIKAFEAQSERHAKQWVTTLREYAKPLHDLPIATMTVDDVVKCLTPHWTERPVTADRLRGRIKATIDYGIARGLRTTRILRNGRAC